MECCDICVVREIPFSYQYLKFKSDCNAPKNYLNSSNLSSKTMQLIDPKYQRKGKRCFKVGGRAKHRYHTFMNILNKYPKTRIAAAIFWCIPFLSLKHFSLRWLYREQMPINYTLHRILRKKFAGTFWANGENVSTKISNFNINCCPLTEVLKGITF